MRDQTRSTLTYLGHASFKIVTPNNRTILIDPWLVDNPSCPPALKAQDIADVILITHGHDDHLDRDLPRLAHATGAAIVAPPAVRLYLTRQGVEELEPMNTGGSVVVRGVGVTMTNAFHWSHIEEKDGTPTLPHGAVGYVVRTEDGLCLYHAGDTGVFGDMRLIGELYRPHVALLPIGDRFTMGPLQAAHAIRLLAVRRVVPMHYGTFPSLTGTPADLREETRDVDGLDILVMAPGDTWEWDGTSD